MCISIIYISGWRGAQVMKKQGGYAWAMNSPDNYIYSFGAALYIMQAN